MSKLDSILNGIYCLSQETASTIINLRAYPHIVKNPYSRQLQILFKELHASSLEVFKDIKLDMLEKDLDAHLKRIYSKAPAIEQAYGAFINTISLPLDHILVNKLKMQVNRILLMLIKLAQVSANSKPFYDRDYAAR